MSQINIDLIDAEFSDVPKKNGKGTYGQLTVTYKNDEGKVEAKKLLDFATPQDTFQKLRLAKKGDTFAITRVKNDNGFWEWTDISTQTAPVGKTAQVAAPGFSKPSYETADERAAKQLYIIKQSSISSAVALLAGSGASSADVLKTAQEFVDYVLGERVEDLSDDIPF